MPIFEYKGYRQDGSNADGRVEADGLHDAIAAVKALGIFPREVRGYRGGSGSWLSGRGERALLPATTRQLSTLLAAGVPLIEALRALSDEHTGRWKEVLIDLRERVSGGAGLSRAMDAHDELFPEFYRNMVAAGEQGGNLAAVLARIADYLEKDAAVRAKVRAAMVYPAFMIAVGVVVLAFLFVFVVPKIVRIFENTRAALPFITIVLIAISNLLVRFWWLLLALFAAAVFGARRFSERSRDTLDRLKLRLPGGILQALYYGRFARTLGSLLDGGLPMLRALELAARAVGNTMLETRILDAAKRVAEGARLSASLEGLPPVLLQLIATGERSGTLAELLNRAADSFEAEFERRVQKALSLLEPSMILFMGLVVGFIVMAILLPLFQLNQLVR